MTIITAPFVYWKLDNDIQSARFLSAVERDQALERLRANQTGVGSREFKWKHVAELALEPKSYLWIGMTLLLNVGAAVQNTFGPLILQGLGFDKYLASLLNMPFGALQMIVILAASWAAQRAKVKFAVLDAILIPVVVGLAMLYVLSRDKSEQGPLLLAYYFLAFLFGANPLIVSWIVGNTGGTTKKSVIMSLYNAASSAGNIIGPLLFSANEAPAYHSGLRSVLAIFVTLIAVVLIQAANLFVLNKMNRKHRIRAGKSADIYDHSMDRRFRTASDENRVGHGAESKDLDLTDGKNDEFVYIY